MQNDNLEYEELTPEEIFNRYDPLSAPSAGLGFRMIINRLTMLNATIRIPKPKRADGLWRVKAEDVDAKVGIAVWQDGKIQQVNFLNGHSANPTYGRWKFLDDEPISFSEGGDAK